MNAATTHDTNNANNAPFLAPETHQRAGVETEFTAILQEAPTRPAELASCHIRLGNIFGRQMAFGWPQFIGRHSKSGSGCR